MRSAHATLFFDLVLSSMLVVVVLLSMQKLSDRSGDDDARWTPPLFAPIFIYGPFDCEASIVGAPDAPERLPPVPTPDFSPVFQLPLRAGLTSRLTCNVPWPVVFVAPSTAQSARYWICPSANGFVELRVRHESADGSLTYHCENAVEGSAPYPLDRRKLDAAARAKFPEAFVPPGGSL
jgi:hypothetical protein